MLSLLIKDVAVFDISNELINFWANWEAARYCILAR